MRSLVAIAFLVLLFQPLTAEARTDRLYEKWLIRGEEDILEWEYAGIREGELTTEGLRFSVAGKAAIFRPLPPGFRENVDALRIHMRPKGLDETVLLLLSLDDEGDIERRFSLNLTVREGLDSVYVPLSPYRRDIGEADVLAVSFEGEAEGVTFEGVRFLRFSRLEKLQSVLRSLLTFEPFNPHTINLLLGPAVATDNELIGGVDWQTRAVSVNAYLLVGLSILGMGLLFYRAAGTVPGGTVPRWHQSPSPLKCFFIAAAAVWLLYDLRMGAEFIRNVGSDHIAYVAAAPGARTFRDRGRFYDFAEFVRPLVQDRERYEVFFPDQWPYFGSIRYATYPALPNPGAPVSDTWVVYERPDITIGEDGKLYHDGESFTEPGVTLGRFDEDSFVFRAPS